MKLALPKLTKEQMQWAVLGVLGIVLIVIVFSMFLIAPGLEKKRTLVKDYLEKSEKLKQDERTAGKKGKLQASLKQLTQKNEELRKEALQKSGPFSMLTILSEKSQECGITFERIEPRDVPDAEKTAIRGYAQKDYLLRFQAGYHQLGAFLNKLENASSFVDVRDVRITGLPDRPALHDVQVTVRCLLES